MTRIPQIGLNNEVAQASSLFEYLTKIPVSQTGWKPVLLHQSPAAIAEGIHVYMINLKGLAKCQWPTAIR